MKAVLRETKPQEASSTLSHKGAPMPMITTLLGIWKVPYLHNHQVNCK